MYATELMELLSSGKLKITISQIYDLKDAAKAHTDLEVYDFEPVLISGEENNREISLEDILASGLLQRGISTICCEDTDGLVMSIHSTGNICIAIAPLSFRKTDTQMYLPGLHKPPC